MSDQKVVLSLNLPALERLIGGDSELELDLRRGIAETFAKHYLKSIVNQELVQGVEREVRSEIAAAKNAATAHVEKVCHEMVGDWEKDRWGSRGKFVLNDAAKSAIEGHIDRVSWDAVGADMEGRQEKWEKWLGQQIERTIGRLYTEISEQVDKRIAKLSEESINAEIQRRLAAAAGGVK